MLGRRRRKRNIFFVLSPFQLICAQEAREKFCRDEINYLVLIDRKGPGTIDYQLKIRERDSGWDKVLRLSEPKRRGFPRFLSRLKNTAIVFATQGYGRGKVFMGDPYINWFRYLSKFYAAEVIWLDDGAASINVIKRFRSEGMLDGPNDTTPKFFSVFATPELEEVTNGALERNMLDVLRSKRRVGQKVAEKRAVFIGQWLSERGGVAEDDEVATLKRGIESLSDWTLTYVPHRHESPEKLARISEFMSVERFDRSIETALLEAEELPAMIVSWYSTALFTLNLLFPEIRVQSFMVPLINAGERHKAEWLSVYDVLAAQGVEIHDHTGG